MISYCRCHDLLVLYNIYSGPLACSHETSDYDPGLVKRVLLSVLFTLISHYYQLFTVRFRKCGPGFDFSGKRTLNDGSSFGSGGGLLMAFCNLKIMIIFCHVKEWSSPMQLKNVRQKASKSSNTYLERWEGDGRGCELFRSFTVYDYDFIWKENGGVSSDETAANSSDTWLTRFYSFSGRTLLWGKWMDFHWKEEPSLST